MSELEGWLTLVHPDILEEFNKAKADDPYFIKLPSSKLYDDTKLKVDELINQSGLEFEQRVNEPQYPHDIGYYYQGELVFKYERLAIEGFHDPRITYWDDFRKRPNSRKEDVRCFNDRDCHNAFSAKAILGKVKHLIDKIKSANKRRVCSKSSGIPTKTP